MLRVPTGASWDDGGSRGSSRCTWCESVVRLDTSVREAPTAKVVEVLMLRHQLAVVQRHDPLPGAEAHLGGTGVAGAAGRVADGIPAFADPADR